MEPGDAAKAAATTSNNNGRNRKRKQRESMEVKPQEEDKEVEKAPTSSAVEDEVVVPVSFQAEPSSWLSKEQLEKVRNRGVHWYSSSFQPYWTTLPPSITAANNTPSTTTASTKKQVKKAPVQKQKSGTPPPIIDPSSESLVELYGKQIPLCTPGVCCLCEKPTVTTTSTTEAAAREEEEEDFGHSTEENKDEEEEVDFFRCHTCLREFHFQCCHSQQLIALHQSTNSNRCCSFCDPLDTSVHLLQYFEKCNEDRSSFDSSYDYVLHTLVTDIELQLKIQQEQQPYQQEQIELSPEISAPERIEETSGAMTTRGRNRNKTPPSSTTTTTATATTTAAKPPTVIIVEDTDNYGIEFLTNNSNDNTFKIKRPETELDHIHELSPSFNTQKNSQSFATSTLPEHLLGKCVHLYCPFDNTYHIGRIIDWRKARPFMKLHPTSASGSSAATTTNTTTTTSMGGGCEFYGKGEIHTCEFLVRFLPGVNGRKRMVQEWIILEEHSVALGIDLVWATNFPTTTVVRNKKQWRPAILFLRTAREIATDVDNILTPTVEDVTSSDYTVVCLFFLEDTWAFPRIHEEIFDFFSPQFVSHRNQPATRTIQLAVALANVEAMEQAQVTQWNKLVAATSSNPFDASFLDYDTLPPLFLDDENCSDDKLHLIRSLLKSSYQQQYPRLCHQIRSGMDYIWISRLAAEMKKTTDNERDGVDTIRNMKLRRIPPSLSPFAMAHIKEIQKQQIASEETVAVSLSAERRKQEKI